MPTPVPRVMYRPHLGVLGNLSILASPAILASFAMNIGILGIILYLLPYFYITLKSRDRRYALLYLVFLILYAYQRFDLFWISLILCYTFGICLKDKEFELCKK